MKTFTCTIRDINSNRTRSTVLTGNIRTITGAMRKINSFIKYYEKCDFELTCNYSNELFTRHWQDNGKYTNWKACLLY